MNTTDLKGSFAFLNGTKGLDDIENDFWNALRHNNIEPALIDNLFEAPLQLLHAQDYENLVLFTTGIRAEKIQPLFKLFERSNIAPKNVIFLSEDTALTFCSLARELKEKFDTKFWFVDFINKNELYPIEWI